MVHHVRLCDTYAHPCDMWGAMHHWDEMRTAYAVARLGTVSAAAESLGLHRATVARHIDALEAALGGRLFQRHGRGYTPTEAGLDLLRVAGATDEQFRALAHRTRGRRSSVTGELVVTSLELLSPLVLPGLLAFQTAHPEASVRFEASSRRYRLEYGEAHVAVRVGRRPEEPDNLVRPYLRLASALYAHRDYVARHGLPRGDYTGHRFIGPPDPASNQGAARWLREHVPDAWRAFTTTNERVQAMALRAGLGIAFHPVPLAAQDPDLVQVCPPDPSWEVDMWLVTHVDLHWTAKVQAALRHLADHAPGGPAVG
jgi:DNA-binding transcriptional LysR family regulator